MLCLGGAQQLRSRLLGKIHLLRQFFFFIGINLKQPVGVAVFQPRRIFLEFLQRLIKIAGEDKAFVHRCLGCLQSHCLCIFASDGKRARFDGADQRFVDQQADIGLEALIHGRGSNGKQQRLQPLQRCGSFERVRIEDVMQICVANLVQFHLTVRRQRNHEEVIFSIIAGIRVAGSC